MGNRNPGQGQMKNQGGPGNSGQGMRQGNPAMTEDQRLQRMEQRMDQMQLMMEQMLQNQRQGNQ